MDLSKIEIPFGAHKRKRIKGRGSSSGCGGTSTRGSKGASSRSGYRNYLGFEGGQTPLIRRIPKRGFVSKVKNDYQVVNLAAISRFKENTIIDPEFLESKGIIKDKDKLVKLLGDGEIKHPLKCKLHAFSKSAKGKIEKAGGEVQILTQKEAIKDA